MPPRDDLAGLVLPAHRRPWSRRAVGRASVGSEEAWLLGYLWLRLGRHDLAHRWWDRVVDRRLLSRTQASRAASLRELGLHDRAEDADRTGLSLVGPGTSPADRAALLIGLVADAVGRGGATVAGRRLDPATAAVAALGSGREADRQRIRLGWVTAEVELMTGRRPTVALPRLGPEGVAAPKHYAGGCRHHLAKGLLFAGVSDRDAATLAAAAELAPPGLVWAVHLARADVGVDGALERAREARRSVLAPRELREAVAATPTARRLASPTAGG